jgi:autotransporter translocation and assembly factor TamB
LTIPPFARLFHRPELAGEEPDPDANLAAGAADRLPKVAKVAQEQVVEPKIDNPQPEEKPLGETMKALFSQPVLPEMTDVHLPLNLNIQSFRGEQLRVTGDTDMTVYNMLLKVSSIDGQMKLDALDIDSDQGKVTPRAPRSCRITGRWTSPSTVR